MTRVIFLLDVYVTVGVFVDIGYIAGVECIFGRARWLKTRRTGLSSRPPHILDLNGELLDGTHVLASLASEVRDISGYATYVVRNDEALGDELERVAVAQPTTAGRRAGVTMPDFLVSGKSGRSRKEMLV